MPDEHMLAVGQVWRVPNTPTMFCSIGQVLRDGTAVVIHGADFACGQSADDFRAWIRRTGATLEETK